MIKKEIAIILLGYTLNVFIMTMYYIGYDFFKGNEFLSSNLFFSLLRKSLSVSIFTLAPVVGLYYFNKKRVQQGKSVF
jgi:hypothetical protein